MKNYQAELFLNKKHLLAEGPFYDARYQRLSWVDILAGKLYTMQLSGQIAEFSFDQMVGAAVPLKDNDGYIIAAKDGLYLLQNGEKTLYLNLTDTYQPFQRSNDAKADPAGRLWFGSIVWDGAHKQCGNLYYLDGKNVLYGIKDTELSNGMAWSRDHQSFFFSDSEKHAVFHYDYNKDTGAISNGEVLFEITDGVPDGMCIDADDNLWVAVWGGNRVECRSSHAGELLATVHVPAIQVSSCCFYGDALNKLLITTAGDGATGEYDGCLFTCEVESAGLLPDLVLL